MKAHVTRQTDSKARATSLQLVDTLGPRVIDRRAVQAVGKATVWVARCVTYLTICRSSCAPLPVMSSTASRAGNLGLSVFTLPLSMQSFKSQATAKAIFLCTPPDHSCCQWGFSLMQIIQRLPLLRFSFLPSLSPTPGLSQGSFGNLFKTLKVWYEAQAIPSFSQTFSTLLPHLSSSRGSKAARSLSTPCHFLSQCLPLFCTWT